MSLINQMLKDLHQRQHQPHDAKDAVLPGMQRVAEEPKTGWRASLTMRRPSWVMNIFIVIIVAWLVAIAWYVWQYNARQGHFSSTRKQAFQKYVQAQQKTHKIELPTSPSQKSSDTEQSSQTNPQPNATQPSQAIPHVSRVDLGAVQVTGENGATELSFSLTARTDYSVSLSQDKQTISIVFHDTKLIQQFNQALLSNSLVTNVRSRPIDGNLQLQLHVQPGTRIQQLGLAGEQTPNFIVDLVNPELANAAAQRLKKAAQATAIKRAIPLTPGQKAQRDYQKVLAYVNNGNKKAAISLLESIVQSQPRYIPAREMLVTLLIQQHSYADAEQYVAEGRNIDPNYLPFVKLQARVLVEQGDNKQALSVLEQMSPPIKKEPEYYAYMAALYQRTGDNVASAQLYKQLLRLNPTNGVWWLGLGIALEGAGKRNAAIAAYERANNTPNLSPQLKGYVSQKINGLE